MRSALVTLVVSAFLFTVAPRSALASPVDLFGFGARGQGLAGALGADAEGFEAVYYNPAALAFERRPSFALGYQLGTFELEIDGVERPARDAPALSIGFGVPIPFGGALRDTVAFGLGFAIPQTSILIADIPRPSEPHFVIVENRAQTVSIQAALGVRLADWLSIGVGTLALAELRGDIQVAPGPSGRIGSKVKDELVADFALTAGVLVRLLPSPEGAHGLKLALTWRGESRADFDLPITADLGDDFGIPIPELQVRGTAQYDPAELALEATGRLELAPGHALSLGLGASLDQWSAFPQPVEYSAVRANTPPQPPPDFRDVVSLKAGLEGRHTLDRELGLELVPRLGLAWQPTPTREQSGFHNHLDSDRVILAGGLGVRTPRLRIDVAGQWHSMGERVHVKGDSVAEDHPGAPRIGHQGDILFMSLELGVKL